MDGSVREEAPLFPGVDYGNPDPSPAWLGVDWREHLRRVELPGATVNYAEVGEGEETVLFVHGLAGCWRNWLENLPHFGKRYRAVALDLPGFGHSPMPSGWTISMDGYGRLIHQFCDAVGIDKVAMLVGNSMGGFVATEAVIDAPERFERLVLVSAAGISWAEAKGRRFTAGARTLQAAAPFLASRMLMLERPVGRRLAFDRLVRYPEKLRPELLGEQIHPGLGSDGMVDAMAAIIGYDTRERLTEIEIPTLIVWGLSDHIVPVEAALGYHRLIPRSRLEIFEKTGHLPQMERPERFNALLEEFAESSRPLESEREDAGVV